MTMVQFTETTTDKMKSGKVAVENGQIVFCSDNGTFFLDSTKKGRIQVTNLEAIATMELLNKITNPVSGKFYAVIENHTIYSYNGTEWIPFAGNYRVTIDKELSETSTNPVENKAVAAAIGTLTASVNEHITKYNALVTQVGNKVDKVNGKGLSTNDFTNELKTKLTNIAENANNYKHPTYASKASGLYKVTIDATGHVSATTAVAKSDITALGIPAQDTTYNDMTGASASAAGAHGLVPAPGAGKQASFLRGDGTWAVPTDNKVTNTLGNTTKAYVTGTATSSTNTGTQVFDPGVYLTDTPGELNATQYKINDKATMKYDSVLDSITFEFK